MILQKEKIWMLETLLYSFGIFFFHFTSHLFIGLWILTIFYHRGENGESRVGIRKAAIHQQHNKPSSLISKQSMHHGIVATALNAVKRKCMFVVFYKPR